MIGDPLLFGRVVPNVNLIC